MRKTTIKVAELATIFYAILVFMSLLIDSAYYSQFNIRIVSYMSISEILLSCIERSHEYAPSIITALVALCIYHFIFIDPRYKLITSPSDWFNKSARSNNSSSSIPDFYFGPRKSPHAKFSIAIHYNFLAYVIPIIVTIATLVPFREIIFNYVSSQIIIVVFFLVYGIIFFFHPGTYKYLREDEYDWSKHPTFEKMYSNAEFRKKIAPHHFSRTERKLIEINYKYRHVIVCFSFFTSLFVSLCLCMFYSAKDVKENGNDKCVAMQRNGEVIDTRTQNIDYIGESAGYIFIYDRATQGTKVYERHSLDSYLFVKKSIYNSSKINNSEESTIAQNYSSLVRTSLLDSMNARGEIIPCDFAFEHPHMNYQLVEQNLNHYIWMDTTNNTFLEQITLPEDLYESQPSCKELFNLEQYTIDKDRLVKYGFACEQTTYQGNDGTNILALICKGTNYNAWLFYDPTGRNIQQGDKIFKSLSIKHSIISQGKILVSSMPIFVRIGYISSALFASCACMILSFIFVLKIHSKKKQGENDFKIKNKNKESILVLSLIILFFSYICYNTCYSWNPFGNANVIFAVCYAFINCLLVGVGYKLGKLYTYKHQ